MLRVLRLRDDKTETIFDIGNLEYLINKYMDYESVHGYHEGYFWIGGVK